MIDKFRRSVFGWDVRPADVPSPPPPKPTLEEQLLRLLNVASFEQLEVDAEARMNAGLLPGWVREIRDATGTVVDSEPMSYPSLTEAGCDYLVQQLGDSQRAARARYLMPLVRRWLLLRERQNLVGVPVPESAPKPRERAATPPVSIVAPDYTPVGNSVALHSVRRAIEAEHRDAVAERFAERSRHLVGDPAPAFNPLSERVRIDALLRQWNVEHPELAEALAMEHA